MGDPSNPELEKNEAAPKKRRSIFDFDTSDSDTKNIFHNLPIPESELSYPPEYIEKVKSEIEEWPLQVTEALAVRRSAKEELFKFKNQVYNESVLSKEQLKFLSYDDYLESVKDFSNRLAILCRKNKQDEEELKMRFMDTQKKIEDTLLPEM